MMVTDYTTAEGVDHPTGKGNKNLTRNSSKDK